MPAVGPRGEDAARVVDALLDRPADDVLAASCGAPVVTPTHARAPSAGSVTTRTCSAGWGGSRSRCSRRIPLSVLTTDVRTGRAVVLSRVSALPALLASTAIPAFYPNVTIGGRVLMDGGVADQTTLDFAVEEGADEVYLLTPGFSCNLPAPPSTAIDMALHGYNLLSEQRIGAAIGHNRRRTRLHLIPPLCPVEVLPIEFGQTFDLIERATRATLHWLERDEPKPGIARHIGALRADDHPNHPAGAALRPAGQASARSAAG